MKADRISTAVGLLDAPRSAPPSSRSNPAFSAAFAEARQAQAPAVQRDEPRRRDDDHARDQQARREAERDQDAARMAAGAALPASPPAPAPAPATPRSEPADATRGDAPAVEGQASSSTAPRTAPSTAPRREGRPGAAAARPVAATASDADQETLTITVSVPGGDAGETVTIAPIRTSNLPVIEHDVDSATQPDVARVPAPVTVAAAVTVAETVAVAVAVAVAEAVTVAETETETETETEAVAEGPVLAALATAPADRATPTATIATIDAPTQSFAAAAREVAAAAAEGRPADLAHARIVLGDDDRRMVVSVAMRHGTVDVSIRAADPELAHSLGRSHGELDQALRHHGLALGDLSPRDGGERSSRDDRNPTSTPRTRFAQATSSDPVSAPGSANPTLATDPRLRALA